MHFWRPLKTTLNKNNILKTLKYFLQFFKSPTHIKSVPHFLYLHENM